MTLAWLCTLIPQNSTRRTHLFLGSASVWTVLRSDLPQIADALKPATPPRDTVVVQEHISGKLQQKRACDKEAGLPLSDLKPGTYLRMCDVGVQSSDSKEKIRGSCRSSFLHYKVKGENSTSKSCSDPISPFHRQRLYKFYTLSTSTA